MMDLDLETFAHTKQFENFESIENLILLINELAPHCDIFIYCFGSNFYFYKNEQFKGIRLIETDDFYTNYLTQYPNSLCKEVLLKFNSGISFGKIGLIHKGDLLVDAKAVLLL